MKPTIVFALFVALTGCVANAPVASLDLVICESPRPQMCTREYRPVCGYKPAPGDRQYLTQSYGNACAACADSEVKGFVAEACPQ
ncbi:hypothetical protein [Amphritea sp. HPY]|uniref:hypothetical protein n=1 Tax=Amphritea sp. HPY TaxID=3421652 RepID=UPI003D7C8C17